MSQHVTGGWVAFYGCVFARITERRGYQWEVAYKSGASTDLAVCIAAIERELLAIKSAIPDNARPQLREHTGGSSHYECRACEFGTVIRPEDDDYDHRARAAEPPQPSQRMFAVRIDRDGEAYVFRIEPSEGTTEMVAIDSVPGVIAFVAAGDPGGAAQRAWVNGEAEGLALARLGGKHALSVKIEPPQHQATEDEITWQRVATAKAVFGPIRAAMSLGETAESAVRIAALTFGVEPPQPASVGGVTSERAWSDDHPWQLAAGSPHWVKVKATGLIGRICDSDRDGDGALLFALHESEDPQEWFKLSDLEPAEPPRPSNEELVATVRGALEVEDHVPGESSALAALSELERRLTVKP